MLHLLICTYLSSSLIACPLHDICNYFKYYLCFCDGVAFLRCLHFWYEIRGAFILQLIIYVSD